MTVRGAHAVPMLAALGAALLLAACQPGSDPGPAPEPTATRPNILWLVAEDLSPIIPPFGDTTVETPNLSRLAAEGIRYTNAFSVSGVCAPSRFTLATGVYTTSAGAHHMRTQYNQHLLEAVGLTAYEVVTPPEVRMMSEVLRTHGYYATNNDKTDHQFVPTVTAWDASGPDATWRGRPTGAPFFAVLNFGITHEGQVWADRVPCRNMRYHELFRPSVEVRAHCDGETGPFPDHVPGALAAPRPPYLPDTEPVHRDLRRVYSNIVELDRQIGVVLDALESDGLLDDTIVVFYADHGGPLPRQKRLLYDSGIRVPLIVRFPDGRGAGTVRERLVSFADFAPTTFSLAGIAPPDYLEGMAFLGEHEGAPRDYVFAAADRLDAQYDMIRAVRDRRFKYLRNFRPSRATTCRSSTASRWARCGNCSDCATLAGSTRRRRSGSGHGNPRKSCSTPGTTPTRCRIWQRVPSIGRSSSSCAGPSRSGCARRTTRAP